MATPRTVIAVYAPNAGYVRVPDKNTRGMRPLDLVTPVGGRGLSPDRRNGVGRGHDERQP